MDMYQKRKIRAEMKNNNQEEKLTKVGINWERTTYINFRLSPYFIRYLIEFLFTFFQKNQ